MPNLTHLVELAGGKIGVRIDQGHVICLRTVTPDGDPVEMSENEADELIATLQKLRR